MFAVIFSHIFIFFYFPIKGNRNLGVGSYCQNETQCNEFKYNTYLIIFYILYIFYLILSGLQVKHGFYDIKRKSFFKKNADDIILSPLAERVKFLKETPKGVERMCKVMEERVKDAEYREKVSFAVKLLKRGKDTIEEIAELTGLTIEVVNQINEELKGIPA